MQFYFDIADMYKPGSGFVKLGANQGVGAVNSCAQVAIDGMGIAKLLVITVRSQQAIISLVLFFFTVSTDIIPW